MVDTAARLVDEVLPEVPVRQFVLSLPFDRLALGRQAHLCATGRVPPRCQRLVSPPGSCARLQWRALRLGVQRFGSSINLNPHFHVLFLDGVYVPAADGGAPVFVASHRSA